MTKTLDTNGLRDTFRGQILSPRDAGYDEARTVWNAMIDRRPAVILRCADSADVVTAVRFARERDLLLSVRGGGHNAAGMAVCDDGVMIDLSGMRDVAVDPGAKRGVVQGGATWTDVDDATQRHGLAVTGGHVGTTGVGGLTLGGGFGWLHGKYGLTSDNLRSAEVVTAEGRVLRASDDENADLFWGLRGGGGNFGIVTSFEFTLHPVVDPFGGAFIFPRDRAVEIIEAYDAFVDTCPHEIASMVALLPLPEVDLLPDELHGMDAVVIRAIYPGATIDEGERALEPVRALGAMFQVMGPFPYEFVQNVNPAGRGWGMQRYFKSGRIDSLDGAVEPIIESQADPSFNVQLIQLGGQISRLPADATAFAHRGARYQYLLGAGWEDPKQSDDRVAAARKIWRTVEPHIAGAFVNFLSTEDWQDRVGDAYGAEHGRRLAAIKRTYDPDNFFRMNANITPA